LVSKQVRLLNRPWKSPLPPCGMVAILAAGLDPFLGRIS